MKRTKDPYRLPDGTYTTSERKHAKAWGDIGWKVGRALEASCIAFDPGLLFVRNKGSSSFELPVDVAQAIARLYDLVSDHRLDEFHSRAQSRSAARSSHT